MSHSTQKLGHFGDVFESITTLVLKKLDETCITKTKDTITQNLKKHKR